MSPWEQLFFSEAFFSASLQLALPVLLAALGETVAERAGLVNIGLEGMMLAGAFCSAFGALAGHSPWIGLAAGAGGGLLLAMIAAYACIALQADQVVVGVALNMLAGGATTFLTRTLFGIGDRPVVPSFVAWEIPLLGRIPTLGPALFHRTPDFYLAVLLVALAWFVLFRTGAGLALRSSGEQPQAAASAGIAVAAVRFVAQGVCGALAGAGGAVLVLSQVHRFIEGMSAGRGFIALAVVIIARWQPALAAAVALLFGAAEAVALRVQALDLRVPYQLILLLPYALTLAAYIGWTGRTRAPAALGKPFSLD